MSWKVYYVDEENKEKEQEKLYSVNQFSRIIGVSANTLRRYDNNGLFKPICKDNNGKRLYAGSQVEDYFSMSVSKKGYLKVNKNS